MTPETHAPEIDTRRHFFGKAASGVGAIALAHLLGRDLNASDAPKPALGGLDGLPHYAPKAKRVIWLFQSGGPSQIETFDPKPGLAKLRGKDLPESIRKGQRLTTMTSGQSSFPLVESAFGFQQHGESGAWISDLLPHTAKIADDISIVRSMHTDAINHDPAVTFLQTGAQIAGRPSVGAWLSYGLGSESSDLPAFVVMITQGTGGQPLYDRLWGSGFLPTRYQGVKFRSVGDPVLYLSDPAGISRDQRRTFLDALAKLNRKQFEEYGDPEIVTRIAQYEMAFKMQRSVPELTDLSGEPERVFDLYGEDARRPGTYAYNCLLARRLAERGVRFIQLYHRGWDQHGSLKQGIQRQTKTTDQASAALVMDLKQRGLLDDTLVVWGGEFGRTVYCQGTLTESEYGRDHHPRCFSIWMAGGGVRPGQTYGSTDEFSYNISENPVSVHDLHATMLHLLGVDHTKLTFKFQGRRFRLTDVHGNAVKPLLA
ncbi:MAG: DUF1501 domain-containing protein [Acidobacteriia bacterium]|nr:DUF1501 domain-containing protein [Terriglobia bacterium]MYG01665.1 DUF1501 domain-containing protein [Terriglobia bacterium]MYK12235.1 DUF1501 domain-containing protein [Terriglobia bacterium]